MKSYDYYAVIYDCEIYCNECIPNEISENDCYPIFADSEWDYAPVCDKCGEIHDYVNIIDYED